ncbi:PspC domain-containing protein [Nocardioides limicola]|uniref:PspC domain-containing protein n=1 Tax=Nocardioides limicola TaxID=2803368 RepID=UPI00193C7D03|nr:PspC domain-containing protein [Nocardioides sp. DJM-14]
MSNPVPMGPKKLTRRPNDAMLGGVCSGLASYLGVDANIMRVLTVIALVFTGFFPVGLAYIILWLILPES